MAADKANNDNDKLDETRAAKVPEAQPLGVSIVGGVGVSLKQAEIADTPDQPLWSLIRQSAQNLSFDNYRRFMDDLFCDSDSDGNDATRARDFRLPFADVHSYRFLKGATELFMMHSCGVMPASRGSLGFFRDLWKRDKRRLGLELDDKGGPKLLQDLWGRYLTDLHEPDEKPLPVIPYLAAVRSNLQPWNFRFDGETQDSGELCDYLLREKFTDPCLLELIWSFWLETGGLVGTMRGVSLRFQNKRGRSEHDPLAEFELTPLRPLNNLLWGYVQDEQHRLTVERRLYEYDHHYGLRLSSARSVGFRPADSRSRFLEAFHNLLHKAVLYYKDADDTTVVADAFPVLNVLRDVHLILSEGAHNQFGDLPWTARQEMLMEQWLLSRPEFDRFLPSRDSVVFPEAWMPRVEAYKRLRDRASRQVSIRHYRDLATFGEQLLLSIRYGNWAVDEDPDQAANWARFWRPEIQWYIHAYQAVTGVDLSAGLVDVRQAEGAQGRAAQPATLMRGAASRASARWPQVPAERR